MENISHGDFLSSLSEIAALILVTCFPIMPRFVQLIWHDQSSSRSSKQGQSYKIYHGSKRSSNIDYDSRLKSGQETWITGGSDLVSPSDAYHPLAGEQDSSVARNGIQRKISIELTTHM